MLLHPRRLFRFAKIGLWHWHFIWSLKAFRDPRGKCLDKAAPAQNRQRQQHRGQNRHGHRGRKTQQAF